MSDGQDYHFIFIVDRSGSMGCSNRIGLARDALSIFVRSLPVNCKFSIISFGSDFECMKLDNRDCISYKDKTKDAALEQIESFDEDFGGTNILSPLKYAQTGMDSGLKKRVFLLTDGAVSDRNSVIEACREHS